MWDITICLIHLPKDFDLHLHVGYTLCVQEMLLVYGARGKRERATGVGPEFPGIISPFLSHFLPLFLRSDISHVRFEIGQCFPHFF